MRYVYGGKACGYNLQNVFSHAIFRTVGFDVAVLWLWLWHSRSFYFIVFHFVPIFLFCSLGCLVFFLCFNYQIWMINTARMSFRRPWKTNITFSSCSTRASALNYIHIYSYYSHTPYCIHIPNNDIVAVDFSLTWDNNIVDAAGQSSEMWEIFLCISRIGTREWSYLLCTVVDCVRFWARISSWILNISPDLKLSECKHARQTR